MSLLARRFKVDVSTSGTGGWTSIKGCRSVAPLVSPTVKVMTVFGGRPGALVVDYAWTLTVVYKQRLSGASRDPGQALVEAAVAQLGDDAALYVRWYDRNGLPEAFQGHATIAVAPTQTDVTNLAEMQAVFAGDGDLTKIGNPV